MAAFLSRFLRLEKPREKTGTATPLASPGRFGNQPAPHAPAEPEPTADAHSSLDRFRPAQPPPAAPILGPPTEATPLADAEHPDAQPFLRCAFCEADSHRSSLTCTNCGARFDSGDQRTYNDRFWAARREADALEAAELERMRKEAPRATQYLSGGAREYGEAMAKMVRAREEGRLGWMNVRQGHGRQRPGADSLGMRLLRRIKDPGHRLFTSVGLLALGGVFSILFTQGGTARLVSSIFFFAVILLFVPRGGRLR